MRNIVCILMCLSMASVVSALSITNGDFEALGVRNNVPNWFEENDPEVYLRLHLSPNGTQYMGLPWEDCWAYQSIGVNTEGAAAIQIQYEIGGLDLEISPNSNDDPPSPPDELILTVSIYESDGSFEGADGRDVDGAQGATLIDSVEVTYPRPANGTFITDSVTLQYLGSTSGELFLRFENVSGDEDDIDYRLSIDNVQIIELVPSIVSPLPKDGTELVAVERSSPENDLIFDLVDDDIVKIEVRFAPDDPNLSSSNKIFEDMPASIGQYRITLETEYPQDLTFDKDYFWQVLAYEPNGMEVSLKYESPVWSYQTIQYGPYLGYVDPGKLYVAEGEDAVFTIDTVSKADTFQWYKEGEVDPLENGSKYAGVHTDTLTVLNAQLDDAGFYYCEGKETATNETDRTENEGELRIKRLMAYYPFEIEDPPGYTPDTIGGKHMQLIGGASISDVNSIIGNNLLLVNPGNQWARIADSSVADYEDVTISFWFNAASMDTWAPIFEFGTGATEYIMFTPFYRQDHPRQNGLDVARCEFRYIDDEGVEHNPELDAEHPDITTGRWYHIAITIKADEDGTGASGRIYIGGQHGTETETPQRLNVPKLTELTKTLNYIGQRFSYSAPYYNGRIDEFKIYNYAKTSEEIAQEYIEDVPGTEVLCDMEIYDLYDWDYDSNCIVDLGDFAEIAEKWMADYRIFPD